MRAWLKRIRDRLVDKLAVLVWEGFCRLALFPDIDLLREQVVELQRRLATTTTTTTTTAAIRVGVGETEGAFSDLQYVEFRGAPLARSQGSVGDLRIQKVLYKTEDGRFLVHIKSLERSAGFPTTHSLYAIEEIDLAEGGSHEALGREWRALSLSEVLS